MPRVHDPALPAAGPGSALLSSSLMRAKARRGRKKKNKTTGTSRSHQPTATQADDPWIGDELLEWRDDEDEPPTQRKIIVQEPNSSSRGKSTKKLPHGSKESVAFASNQHSPSVQTSSLPAAIPPTMMKHVRHALLVDTRALDTEQGRAASQDVLKQVGSFWNSLARRGAPPCLIASSYIRGHRTSIAAASRGTIQVQAQLVSNPEEALESLEAVLVRPPLNAANTQNVGAVHTPKRLLAHDSWKLFGELVDAIVKEDKMHQTTDSAAVPLDVTILTNDIAFLCDTKETSHKSGLNRFWERLGASFRADLIRSVEIVVAKTGSVEMVNSASSKKPKGTDDDDDGNSTSTDGSSKSDGSLQRQAVVVQCLRSIQNLVERRVESDYKKMGGFDDPINPVVLRLSSIDNSGLGYQTLVRKWITRIMSPPNSLSGKISFELPETIDGMQCSLSLDVYYKTMPYRVDSVAAAGMLSDLQLLSESTFEVIQLVPLSCVDAKLMFGVPMEARAALESDIQQYKEMKILLSFFLRYLIEKDLGLILRSSGGGCTSRDFGAPLNHMDGQLFLLMGEELPGRAVNAQAPSELAMSQSADAVVSGKPGPCTGILFRYTSTEQFLDAGSSEVFAIDGDMDTLKQFAECVESSLDFVGNNSINPLMIESMPLKELGDKPAPTRTKNVLSDTEEDVWAKECGVGKRMCKDDSATMDCSDGSEGEDQEESESFNSFSYDG